MRDCCPKCEADIFQDLYEEFMESIDFGKHFDYECPKCGAKLSIYVDWNFVIDERE